ncbi:helicase [Candidatus Uhrbacteria bacterium]|jgi:DEAD/DEAH box helicase domain-containing protein|nr:helicase [Candidatus Uhrbacteria bacterium]
MSNEVVLDIETQNTFQEVGGFKTNLLKISVVCAYFYETGTYECYEEHELGKFYKRLELSGRLIGYNSLGFDLPVMNNYYAGDFLTFQNLDLLKEIHKSLGFRLKLDDVAAATVGHRKSGHGLQAVEWWKQGEVQKIKDYCIQDVKVTKDVYEYGKKYNALAYEDRLGGRKAIPVDFSEKVEDEKTSINLSMGF